ncbi:ABC transporter ATP-binding protein [Tabrizicola sp.]|uniref:ABC transporter ATP-binding protein n=1 Tax=Tabrizicola sp. TaxID=2005166 RepID=UPI0035AF39BA
MTTPALELRNLCKTYQLPRKGGWFGGHIDHPAVRDVSLTLPPNAILGLVGESGSGKTTTGLMAMRLIEPTSGRILIDGSDITGLDPAALKPFRRKMQIVFQDNYSALNPMMTLQRIIAEPLHIHGIGTAEEQAEQALALLDRVGLHRDFGRRYPHELSGGQRQRVAIARALILRPKVLVADEPTSALDVSVKAQIINLLLDLQRDMGLSILFISHDLSVVRSLTDRVAVMFNGRIVETAATESIFGDARHPYTQGLLSAIPVLNPRDRRPRRFLSPAEIQAATPRLPGAGSTPGLVEVAPGHLVEAIAG